MDLNLSTSDHPGGSEQNSFHRYIFNSRKQEDNETIEEFASALNRLGVNAGANEQAMVDRFVVGLKNDSARFGILQVMIYNFVELFILYPLS